MKSQLKSPEPEKAEHNQLDGEELFQNPAYILLVLDLQVYFWRTTSGAEVDFIVYGESGLFAFELKSRANIESRDLTHLKSFKTDYDIAQCYLVYAGDKAEQHKDIQVIPIKQALMSLPSILGKSSD